MTYSIYNTNTHQRIHLVHSKNINQAMNEFMNYVGGDCLTLTPTHVSKTLTIYESNCPGYILEESKYE